MKAQKYKVRGHVYALSSGFVYDTKKAELVPCVIVERPGPFGKSLPFASAKTALEGEQVLADWLSIPITRIKELSI